MSIQGEECVGAALGHGPAERESRPQVEPAVELQEVEPDGRPAQPTQEPAAGRHGKLEVMPASEEGCHCLHGPALVHRGTAGGGEEEPQGTAQRLVGRTFGPSA